MASFGIKSSLMIRGPTFKDIEGDIGKLNDVKSKPHVYITCFSCKRGCTLTLTVCYISIKKGEVSFPQ